MPTNLVCSSNLEQITWPLRLSFPMDKTRNNMLFLACLLTARGDPHKHLKLRLAHTAHSVSAGLISLFACSSQLSAAVLNGSTAVFSEAECEINRR